MLNGIQFYFVSFLLLKDLQGQCSENPLLKPPRTALLCASETEATWNAVLNERRPCCFHMTPRPASRTPANHSHVDPRIFPNTGTCWVYYLWWLNKMKNTCSNLKIESLIFSVVIIWAQLDKIQGEIGTLFFALRVVGGPGSWQIRFISPT